METTTVSETDRIEKQIFLRAPRSRVWRALADHRELGAWFGVKLEAPFSAGARVKGKITTPGYEHLVMEMSIERIEPERVFSYRWHPHAVDANVDYAKEETTLVTFSLEDKDGGTLLRVVESGFDRVPLARRKKAYEMNGKGWSVQMENIERHVLGGA